VAKKLLSNRKKAETTMTRLAVLLLASIVGLAGCSSHKASAHKPFIEFSSFTVEDGVYKPKPGWKFTKGEKKGTIIVARQSGGPGVVITPCECALETGGNCAQVTIDGPDGQIKEIFCDDNGCGFCVGGTVDPDNPANNVRFSVVSHPRNFRQP
jgi:hypothetical protein